MNRNDYITNSKRLLENAEQIVGALDIYNHWKQGKIDIVGSMAYNLMAWEDIDIDLITQGQPQDKDIWETAKYLSKLPAVKLLMLADNRAGDKEHDRPKSVYLGLKYDYKGTIWKIDIRLIAESELSPSPDWKLALSDITEEQRSTILQIKYALKDDPRYHHEIPSVAVYQAVLEQGINSLDEFMQQYAD